MSTQLNTPSHMALSGGLVGVELVVDNDDVHAWLAAPGCAPTRVDGPFEDAAIRSWLQAKASKVTFFGPSQWAALTQAGIIPAGFCDIALALDVLTAGLPVLLDRQAVLEALSGEPLGMGPDGFSAALVGVWATLEPLLRDSGLAATARIETAVAPWFHAMGSRGVPVDLARWEACIERASRAVVAAIERFARLTGAPSLLDGHSAVNLERAADVMDGFRRLGVELPADLSRRTLRSAVAASTDGKFVGAVHALLAYRGAKNVLDWADVALPSGRLRGDWRQLGAATGRASCANPALLSIPGPLRACVRPPAGFKLVVADYGGQELRVLAALSHDVQLIDDLNGGDPYSRVAELAGVTRSCAKPAVLAYFYGASDTEMAAGIDRPVETAATLRAVLNARYPAASEFLSGGAQVRSVRLPGPLAAVVGADGELVEIAGPQRRRFAYSPTDGAGRARLSRQARNFGIQPVAATMSKLALGRVCKQLAEAESRAGVVHFVHDELVIETPAAQVAPTAELVRSAMVWAHLQVLGDAVQPVVNARTVDQWAEPSH